MAKKKISPVNTGEGEAYAEKETSDRRMMPFGQYFTFFTVVVLPRTVVVVSTLVEPSMVTVKLEPGREVATFM